jgi:hypothetical protein
LAFRKFCFQLVIVATARNATNTQPYIDSVVMVSTTEGVRLRREPPGPLIIKAAVGTTHRVFAAPSPHRLEVRQPTLHG